MAGSSGIFSDFRKLSFVAAFLAMLLISISFGFLIKAGELKAGIMILMALIGPVAVYVVIAYPKVGMLILLITSYLVMWIMRMDLTTFPLGTVMDGLLMLLIIGFFIRQKYENDWKFLKSPISLMIIVWICYNLIQVANPSAVSRLAWLYTIRTVALVMLNYFIFSFQIRSIGYVKLLIKTWLALSLFAALYGFKQQFFGFFQFEWDFLYSDPQISDLLFINGVWRKFSIFSDPVAFSYNMVMSSLLCVGLMTGPISKFKKWILFVFIILFLSNMLFSGTRGAFVLFPAGMMFFAVMRLSKQVIFYATIGALFTAFLIMVPTGNLTLYRFQSAFKPSNDASFNVRANNQKKIKPYIQTHPLGGGLGSTGVWGVKFSPGSFLASFPPDSGYVRVAVETGWIGLLLFCSLLFTIIKVGIDNYHKIIDPGLKSYCLSMTLIVFALIIGSYPQEALVQYPSTIIFYLVAALVNITYKLDQKKNEQAKLNAESA